MADFFIPFQKYGKERQPSFQDLLRIVKTLLLNNMSLFNYNLRNDRNLWTRRMLSTKVTDSSKYCTVQGGHRKAFRCDCGN